MSILRDMDMPAKTNNRNPPNNLVGRFNRAVPLPVRLFIVLLVGLALLKGIVHGSLVSYYSYYKLEGEAPDCPWDNLLKFRWHQELFDRFKTDAEDSSEVIKNDSEWGLELVSSPGRDFWVKPNGGALSGSHPLSYLLAEHRWVIALNPEDAVRLGDVVLDCGAHVGVFVHHALELGASKVIAIEPALQNLEALRRNFRDEIADGRVIVVPKGVWSEETVLKLNINEASSGMNSVVRDQGSVAVEIPVTTIDMLVDNLGLESVDYIKMDIEGAERNAIKGALGTIERFRPRLMLDSYHRPDDMQVLPAILRSVHADYKTSCGPCEQGMFEGGPRLVPHVAYYH